MNTTTIHLDRGTRIRLATEYIVADTPEEAESIHQSILQGILTPNYDQYGGATISGAIDGAGTEYIGFCAKQLSSGTFGYYIINLVTMQALPYSPFCTGRGSINNRGRWYAWRDKDYFKGDIPGFVGYPAPKNYDAEIATLGQQIATLTTQNAQLVSRAAALEQQIVELQTALANVSTGGAALSTQDREALSRLRAWLGIA